MYIIQREPRAKAIIKAFIATKDGPPEKIKGASNKGNPIGVLIAEYPKYVRPFPEIKERAISIK
jgi:hypothetical protein